MKKIIRSTTTYICEICGKKSIYKNDIELCELKCKCKHQNIGYRFNESFDDKYEMLESTTINKYCIDCYQTLDTVEYDIDTCAKLIYDSVKGNGNYFTKN